MMPAHTTVVDDAASPSERSLGTRFKARFARRTSSGQLIPEIDGLRFPAIALVVLGHLCAFFVWFHRPVHDVSGVDTLVVATAAHAGEGVFLFFILSGFVLALPFAREHLLNRDPVNLRAYFLRRVTRLEPPYLISLTAFVAVKIVARHFHLAPGAESASELVRHYAVSAAYLHNLVYGQPSMINGVAWSLEVEIQFYLLVPLLTTVFRVQSKLARRGAILAALLAIVLMQNELRAPPYRLELSIVWNLPYFLLGFLLADLFLTDAAFSIKERTLNWDLVSLTAWPLVIALWGPDASVSLTVLCLAFAAFIAVFRGRLSNRVFTNPWITTIGGMCYSIYLLHSLVMTESGKILFRGVKPAAHLWWDLMTKGPVLLALALGASAVFYAAIERPCMDPKWPAKLAARVRRRVGSSTDVGLPNAVGES